MIKKNTSVQISYRIADLQTSINSTHTVRAKDVSQFFKKHKKRKRVLLDEISNVLYVLLSRACRVSILVPLTTLLVVSLFKHGVKYVGDGVWVTTQYGFALHVVQIT